MNPRNIKHGIYAGLAGGVVFGVMMALMGTLPMIGKMVGHPNAAAGALVHLLNSAVIGAAFAILFDRLSRDTAGGLRSGLAYGGIWWLLGPLTLMPLFMGMGLGVNWNIGAAFKMMPSLVGHLVFGVVLGVSYVRLRGRALDLAPARAS